MKRRSQVGTKSRQIKSLEEKLARLIYEKGVVVERELHEDLLDIMKGIVLERNSIIPENSLKRLFWLQLVKAATVSDKQQMCWHPLIIK